MNADAGLALFDADAVNFGIVSTRGNLETKHAEFKNLTGYRVALPASKHLWYTVNSGFAEIALAGNVSSGICNAVCAVNFTDKHTAVSVKPVLIICRNVIYSVNLTSYGYVLCYFVFS